MLELLKALVALRLGVIVVMVTGALVLLALSSFSHGASVAGVGVLAGLVLGLTLGAATLRWRVHHR